MSIARVFSFTSKTCTLLPNFSFLTKKIRKTIIPIAAIAPPIPPPIRAALLFAVSVVSATENKTCKLTRILNESFVAIRSL